MKIYIGIGIFVGLLIYAVCILGGGVNALVELLSNIKCVSRRVFTSLEQEIERLRTELKQVRAADPELEIVNYI